MATSSTSSISSSSSSSKSPPSPSSTSTEPKLFTTNTETFNEAIDAVMKNLIDEEAYNFVVNCGRQLRFGELEALGLLEDTESSEYEVIDVPGQDIFGQPLTKKPNFECECPKCHRTLAAARFAPHLEKCMGMGRNSSRIASLKNRRLAASSSSSNTGGASTSSAKDGGTFSHNTNSNSSDGSNDSSVKNNNEPVSEDDHFEDDEDDEEWTVEKKKKSKKTSEKISPKKKGALSRVKNTDKRSKRGVSPSLSVASSPISTTSSTMDVGNYDELTNDSFSSYL